MTRAEFVSALERSGFDFLELADKQRFVSEAVREFNHEELWPWRLVEQLQTVGTPVATNNLGPIDSVRLFASYQVLGPVRHSELIEAGVNLADVGVPRLYYVTDSTVHTYPVANESIMLRYFSRKSWTDGIGGNVDEPATDADTPTAKLAYHDAILLLCRLRAKEFNDDFDEAGQLWERYQARLEQARQAELVPGWDEPDVVRVSEAY